MKAFGQIVLYLAATVLLGALLAPPLFWIAHAIAGPLHNDAFSAFVAKTDFPRYFDRGILIAALILLWPLLRALKIANFTSALGLQRDRHGWKRFTAGFLIALIPILILGAILIGAGIYRLHSHPAYSKLAMLPVTAIVVSLIEEFLFRGALQGAVRKTTVDHFAMISVAVLFAAVHFLKPPDHSIPPAALHWWSGLELLPSTLSQFSQPALLFGGFTILLIVGLILGYSRDRTRSLWMPVGLHTGWVLGKMSLLDITRHSIAWPWLGPDILIGLAPLITLLITGAIVAWLLKDL